MKRLLIGLAAVLAVSPALAQELPAGPPVAIQMVTQLSPTIPQYTRVDIPMLREELPKRSGGRISVTLASWPERNLNEPELLRVLRAGQIDLGGIALPTVAGDAPLLDIIDLAGLLSSHEMGRKVAEAVMPELNKELERFNVRIIATYPFPAQVFFCRKAVKDLAHLKGRRIRTFGTSLNDLVTAIGGVPVSLAFAEVYGALERGVADCAITGTGSGNAAKWYEVTTHMYTLPVGWSLGGYYVNVAWWNKLDPAVRKFLEDIYKEIEDRQWTFGGVELTQDGIDCNTGKPSCKIGTLAKDRPMTEVKPIDADRALLRKILAENVLPAWVKRCGAKCGDTYNTVLAPITGVKYTPR